jgi:hypothetical protein
METAKLKILFEKLDLLNGKVGGVPDDLIEKVEFNLELKFPMAYRRFLQRYGTIAGDQLIIFGLGVPSSSLPSVECALLVIRAIHSNLPKNLIPFILLEKGVFACLDPTQAVDGIDGPPVIRWDIRLPWEDGKKEIIGTDFASYLIDGFAKDKSRQEGIKKLRDHVQSFSNQFNYDHASGGKLPRNHIWRPYRFCVQDVLLGATVVRHVKGDNFLEVDVFLTEVVPPYEPDSGVRGLVLFLLCEAYKCGGTMEIRFTENVEGGRVPEKIQELAKRLKVPIPEKSLTARRLTPRDARALFAALTPFSPAAFARISELELSIERACYEVQKGIWSLSEAETILQSAANPDRLFSGGAPSEQRLLYTQDILYGRSALLGGYLDRALSYPQRDLIDSNLEVEDDERPLKIQWVPTAHAKTYQCSPAPSESNDHLQLPWSAEGSRVSTQFSFDQQFAIIVRGRDSVELCQSLKQDFQLAYEFGQNFKMPIFILFPYDFYDTDVLEENLRMEVIEAANRSGIGLLICPETTLSLDAQVQQRFNLSRIIRE